MTVRPDSFRADVLDGDGEPRGLGRAMCAFLACMPLVLTVFLAAGGSASAPLPPDLPMTVGLTEAARMAGDTHLSQWSNAYWNLGLFWMAAGVAIFAWRGATSDRRQGWSEAVWIGVVAAICIGAAVLERSDWGTGFFDQPLARLRALGAGAAKPIDPRAALVMRTAWFTLIGGCVALAAHDLAYRARRTMEEFDLINPPVLAPARYPDYAPPRESRARPAGSNAAAQDGSGDSGFGQRQTPPPDTSAGQGMSRGEALLALGVSPTASRKDIGRAFHAAMKTAHPDRGGSTARAAKVNTARDVLLGKRR